MLSCPLVCCAVTGVSGGSSSSSLVSRDLSSVLMQQSYPDMSYCRVPRDIRSLVDAGRPTVVFEAGTVLRWVAADAAVAGSQALRSHWNSKHCHLMHKGISIELLLRTSRTFGRLKRGLGIVKAEQRPLHQLDVIGVNDWHVERHQHV